MIIITTYKATMRTASKTIFTLLQNMALEDEAETDFLSRACHRSLPAEAWAVALQDVLWFIMQTDAAITLLKKKILSLNFKNKNKGLFEELPYTHYHYKL